MQRNDGHDQAADNREATTELAVEGPPGRRADEHQEVEGTLDRGLEGGGDAERGERDVGADAAQEVDDLRRKGKVKRLKN